MKYLILGIVFLAGFLSCSSNDPSTVLSASDFRDEIANTMDAQVLDVRTKEEFETGHLPNAMLADWTGDQFDQQISQIAKDKPVFVYCHSGNRSASAAEYMRENGYTNVKELDGGIVSWMDNGFQTIIGKATVTVPQVKLSAAGFNEQIAKEEQVLIDVYADWCAPCKMMEPVINRLENRHGEKVKVIRINADTQQDIIQLLGVDALPTFVVFKDGEETWRQVGTVEEKFLKEQLTL